MWSMTAYGRTFILEDMASYQVNTIGVKSGDCYTIVCQMVTHYFYLRWWW